MSDIQNLINGTAGDWTDTITPIFVDNFPVGTTDQNFYQYMINQANAQGFRVNLSFGGALAGPTQMTLSENPEQSATDLVQFLASPNTASVDFDVEGAATTGFATSENLTFFSALHTQLSAQGKQSTLTLAGDINAGPEGPLQGIFDDFDIYFDRVNLMLYSTDQYYIDANNETWGISQWLSCVNNNPSKISIGFYDSIAYEDPAASAGKKYNVAGLSRGAAAASIYLQLCDDLTAQLGREITVNDFAAPFWWTDDPTTLPSNEVLQDFYEYLGKNMIQTGVYREHLSELPSSLQGIYTAIRMGIPTRILDPRLLKEFYIHVGKTAGNRA
jgi:hypothetical protein